MIWPSDDPLLTMWQLTGDLTAAGEARRALRAWLSGLRIDSADGTGADLILAASELVANAVTHGRPPVWLSARVDFASGYVPVLVISVTDGGDSADAPSVPAEKCEDGERGRGLLIVDGLADWREVSAEWNACQVRIGFLVPGLTVPEPRRSARNTLPGTLAGGTRTGLPPAASLSALI